MIHIGYLDPGTGTIIVQAILGGTAGVAVLMKSTRRRLSRKRRRDGIDEGAVEEAESVDVGEPEPASD